MSHRSENSEQMLSKLAKLVGTIKKKESRVKDPITQQVSREKMIRVKDPKSPLFARTIKQVTQI